MLLGSEHSREFLPVSLLFGFKRSMMISVHRSRDIKAIQGEKDSACLTISLPSPQSQAHLALVCVQARFESDAEAWPGSQEE